MAGAQGFPDWQRSSQATVSTVYNDTFIAINGQVVLAPIYVGLFSALLVQAIASSLGGLVVFSFDWYNDAAATDFVNNQKFGADITTNYLSIPVQAMWLVVTVTPPDALNRHYSLRINGLESGVPTSARITTDQQPVVDGRGAAPAGSTTTFTPSTICDGLADICVTATAAGFDIVVEEEWSNGLWTPVGAQSFTGKLGMIQGLSLIGYPIRIKVTNNAAVASTLAITMTYRSV